MTDHLTSLLIEQENERTVSRRRETFLLSVILHMLVVILVLIQPDIFSRVFPETAVVVPPAPEQNVTMLYQPPDLPTVKEPPNTRVLSDQNRRAQPGLEAPPPPRLQAPPPPPRPPARQVAPDPGRGEDLLARQLPPIGIPDFPETEEQQESQKPALPALEVLPPPPGPPQPQAQMTLPEIIPPTRGTDAILRGLAKDRAAGKGGSFSAGIPPYDPGNPNMNLPGPQILSDTMGVDFNPYLMRVLSVVRRNWYSVIPEIARLGRKGKVVLRFSILRNGGVPDLVLTAGSGTNSMDSAAMASIRLSNPFPALPPEFPGTDIRLQFTYLYNLPIDY